MAVVAGIVTKDVSLFDQKRQLGDFLHGGRSSFPSRYIDVICKCVVVLEQKGCHGSLTTEEQGFSQLFSSDVAICDVFDFAFSEASLARAFANLTVHPPPSERSRS